MRWLRGRVLIRPIPALQSSILVLPQTDHLQKNRLDGHRGTVVGMGPPALDKRGTEVEPDFAIGDEIVYVHALTHRLYSDVEVDGERLKMIAQEEVIAVIWADCGHHPNSAYGSGGYCRVCGDL